MKNFSDALKAALAAPVKRPVWLLKIGLRGSGKADKTLHLADRPITLWGADWKPAVLEWGAVDRYFDPSGAEVKVADGAAVIDNRPGALGPGEPCVSRHLRDYDLYASTVTLYLWLDGAGLAEPSGQSQNDLLTILAGRPEISMEITPAICPVDIVAREGEWAGSDCPWGDLLSGRYTKNQWPSLPKGREGDFKPAVFGDGVLVEGISLSSPLRAGKVEGPAELFSAAAGADRIHIRFPDGGEASSAAPYPAPFDLYLGDWRFTVTQPPKLLESGAWEYRIHAPGGGRSFYVPTPLLGSTPLFAPAEDRLWPRSDESGGGPYSSSEPASGSPYQFYHGHLDTGSSKDGHNPGRQGASISTVYADGVELTGAEVYKDHGFGIAWIKGKSAKALGRAGNPKKMRVKWTLVDESYTTGAGYLRPEQLTAAYPYGHNAEARPCILGDFAIPASGGGAPVSTKLGLLMSPSYPIPGARVAAARLVMTYTGLEFSSDVSSGTFNVRVFGSGFGFPMSELGDGGQIEAGGWWVTRARKGAEFEIWPGNNGLPYTQTTPDPRHGGVIELSRDVTSLLLANIESNGGIASPFRAWVTGTTWPDTNSLILLGVELEIEFEPVETIVSGPRVTALIGGTAKTAGEIMAALIPAAELGVGFDDPALPELRYRVEKQMTVCDFLKIVARESNTELKKNFITGKWDLVRSMETRAAIDPPAPSGGEADIAGGDMLADDGGLPVIRRLRGAPEKVINEVTVSYTGEDGRPASVTMRDEGSIGVYGLRRHRADLGAAAARQAAEDYALFILNEYSETADFYTMTFPLGPKLALEPNDVLSATAALDSLSGTRMRVVSVEVDPGSIADGAPSTITVNARRYSRARKGYGAAEFGQGPFGSGQVLEN